MAIGIKKSTFKHWYNPENVSSRVEIGTAKTGEQIYLCRMNTKHKVIGGADVYDVPYYALNEAGEVVGRATLSLRGDSSRAELSYFLADEHQGKGIGTIMLHSIVGSALITEEPLDNLPMIVKVGQEPETTLLKTIHLEINEDNYASQRIAEKNGFERVNNTTYEIERSKLFEQYFESQGIKAPAPAVEAEKPSTESTPIVEMLLNDNEINNPGNI